MQERKNSDKIYRKMMKEFINRKNWFKLIFLLVTFILCLPSLTRAEKVWWGFSGGDPYAEYRWESYTVEQRMDRLMGDFQAEGAKWWRPYLAWSSIEPIVTNVNLTTSDITTDMVQNYAFNDPSKNWSAFDTMVNKATSANISLIGAIACGYTGNLPQYDAGGGIYQRILADYIGKDHYLGILYLHTRAMVRRYKDRIHYWQTENELNVAGPTVIWGWRDGQAWSDWEFLTNIMKTMRTAVKEEDPSAQTTLNFHTDVSDWKSEILDWKDYIDIIGLDMYPNYLQGVPNYGTVVGQRVKEAKNLNLGKPVVILETGYPTNPPEKLFSQQGQAFYVALAMDSVRYNGGDGFLHLFFVTGEYWVPPGIQDVEPWWGFVCTDNSYKLAYDVYKMKVMSDTGDVKGMVAINEVSGYTSQNAVTLTLPVTTSIGGAQVSEMIVGNDSSFSGGAWESYTNNKAWNLATGEGQKTVYAKFKDTSDATSNLCSGTIFVDTQKPIGSIEINHGDTYTNASSVELTLNATDTGTVVNDMMLANESSLSSANWQPYQGSYEWILSEGDGEKVVYVKYRDYAGNESPVYQNSIILDKYPPEGEILINSGSSYTSSNSVSLNINASDAGSEVTGMMVSNDSGFTGASWESYTSSKAWTLTPGDGEKTIYVKFRDLFGNENTAPFSAQIFVDSQKPTGAVLINNGENTSYSYNVTLSLNSTDTGSGIEKMMISNNSSFSGSSWETYTTTKNWALSSGPTGQRRVYVKFSDRAGNESAVCSDSIQYVYDGLPPQGSVVINSGKLFTHSNRVDLTLSAADNIGVKEMIVSNNANFSNSNWENYAISKAWTIPSGDGEKTVYVKFKDFAGNTSPIYSDTINLLTSKTIERISGLDRYLTAVEISKKGWMKAETVIMARGDLFPDALAGAPLAKKYNAPLLLTDPGSLKEPNKNEINRLEARKVIILGSEGAVSTDVVSDLKLQAGITDVQRIGGADRYETDSLIAQRLGSPAAKQAIMATGENYPDALASSPLSTYKGMPILLVKKDTIPEAVKAQLKNLGITRTIIVGGSDVVSDSIATWLDSNGYPSTRLSGDDRYKTALAISNYALEQGLDPSKLFIATGENFPDALSISPLAAKNESLSILSRKDFLETDIKDWLADNKDKIYKIYIIGGTGAISDEVMQEIGKII